MFSVNMMEAARQCNVERYLFTSSIGVYEPQDIFEDDVWSSFPSENDDSLDGQKEWESFKHKHMRFNMAGIKYP